jgi:hypothetical protein
MGNKLLTKIKQSYQDFINLPQFHWSIIPNIVVRRSENCRSDEYFRPSFQPINRDTHFLSKIPINEKRSESSTTFMTSTPVARSGSRNFFNYETPSPNAPLSSVDFRSDAGHTPHPAKHMELAVYPSALTD